MNPKTDKLVRRTTMIATVTASYYLLTADYGPEPNALDPIKNAILSVQRSTKDFIFGTMARGPEEGVKGKPGSNSAKDDS
ncbi:hypothetical protein Nepgr_002363 [Nepenthes gracilis]|uniref:Uncharacterized protein n=1 Tax=Nepenthes gracilis TaxID=150966 RepID=A0AAD3P642_NEPGR|nr:hypothetical protein Nepgr_002363 [Nepenthes gracilis]